MSERSLDVVAVGSAYVDINAENYPFGDRGIPAEVELVGEGYEVVPGGSAVNFCRLLASLELKTAFIGMAGTDPNGDILETMLQQSGVRPELIRRPELLTNISFNMTNPEGKHIMLVAGTANAALDPEAVLPKLEDLASDAEMLYLGGCFKLKSFMSSFKQIAELARRHATTLVVDHGRPPEVTSLKTIEAVKNLALSADYYLPSRDEFLRVWEVASIEEGLRMLSRRRPELTVVVKDGEQGACLWSDGAMKCVPSVKVERIVNVTGAGDSFNAGVMAAIAGGRALSSAVEYGCTVAAAKVSGRDLPVLD